MFHGRISVFDSGRLVAFRQPAIVVYEVPRSQFRRAPIPAESGCYVLLDVRSGKAYVGESGQVSGRLAESIRDNLPSATHVLAVFPSDPYHPWTADERKSIEYGLLSDRGISPAINSRKPDAFPQLGEYEEAVIERVTEWSGVLIPRPGDARVSFSQSDVVMELIESRTTTPYYRHELEEEARQRGCTYRGRTAHKTLFRDIRRGAARRGVCVRFLGRQSDPDSVIYVEGQDYTEWSHSG